MNVRCLARISGISHDSLYLGALAAIALSLSVLMAAPGWCSSARNSGWVDTSGHPSLQLRPASMIVT